MTTTTTNGIPPVADILDLVRERHATAVQHEDYAGASQLNRVRMNLLRGAHLAWDGGDLLIQSINTPGAVYAVNRAGCTCPNGRAGKAHCWHVATFDLLVDMTEDRAALADLLADAAETRQELDDIPETRGLRRALDEAAAALGIEEVAIQYADDTPETAMRRALAEQAEAVAAEPVRAAILGQRLAAARAARMAA